MRRTWVAAAAALVLSGCAASYQLSLMPQDRGVIYHGIAEDRGGGEGPISITLDGKAYAGTWVQSTPARASAFVSGGWGGWGWRHGGIGAIVNVDNPEGALSKALLTAPDGSGLRCDFRIDRGMGAGLCRDDHGTTYDVQVRPR